jgi:hypothetical protein
LASSLVLSGFVNSDLSDSNFDMNVPSNGPERRGISKTVQEP